MGTEEDMHSLPQASGMRGVRRQTAVAHGEVVSSAEV